MRAGERMVKHSRTVILYCYPGPTRGISWCSDMVESIVLNSCIQAAPPAGQPGKGSGLAGRRPGGGLSIRSKKQLPERHVGAPEQPPGRIKGRLPRAGRPRARQPRARPMASASSHLHQRPPRPSVRWLQGIWCVRVCECRGWSAHVDPFSVRLVRALLRPLHVPRELLLVVSSLRLRHLRI